MAIEIAVCRRNWLRLPRIWFVSVLRYHPAINCSGKPTEETVKQCACMTMNHVIEQLGIPPERLILYLHPPILKRRYGHSLGSAISVYLSVFAAKTRDCSVAGIILQVGSPCCIHCRAALCPCIASRLTVASAPRRISMRRWILYSFLENFIPDSGRKESRDIHSRN